MSRSQTVKNDPDSYTQVVPPVGLEPTAHRLEVCRSIQLSYGGGG